VKTLLASGNKKMVLNMSSVSMVDSAGLGTLVSLHLSLVSSGASLRLCNLSTMLGGSPKNHAPVHDLQYFGNGRRCRAQSFTERLTSRNNCSGLPARDSYVYIQEEVSKRLLAVRSLRRPLLAITELEA
jgi:hypothetical protein